MPRPIPRFGLDSLMLITALVAGCAAVLRVTLAGIPLSLLCGAALALTMFSVSRTAGNSGRLPVFDKIVLFCISAAYVLVVGGAALLAFLSVSQIIIYYDLDPWLGLFASLSTSGAVGYLVYQLIK